MIGFIEGNTKKRVILAAGKEQPFEVNFTFPYIYEDVYKDITVEVLVV